MIYGFQVKDRGVCPHCGDRVLSTSPNARVCNKSACKSKQARLRNKTRVRRVSA